jgi:hypothetical protein
MPGVSCGPLAQSVEQKTFNLLVDGSNPSRPTIRINHLQKNFSILEMSVDMVRRPLESNVLLIAHVRCELLPHGGAFYKSEWSSQTTPKMNCGYAGPRPFTVPSQRRANNDLRWDRWP